MQIKCPCCGNTCEIESELIVGQHMVCPFCSGKFSYADDGKRKEDLHRGDTLEECLNEKIVIKCPECGTEYEIDKDAIGATCQCSVCNRAFIARDDSSVEIGDAQEEDGSAGTEEPSVEIEDFCSEQDSQTLPKKERRKVFSKERIDALCLKAKELSATKTNQIVWLWKSGVKGKAFLCAAAVIVLWLSFFSLMCGGEPKAGDVKTIKLPGGATMELVYCPPGTFMMGSPASEEGHREDETQHQVTLTRGFWIGKYEVTQEQWESVMGGNPSKFRGKRNPVEKVSWNNCNDFCLKAGGGVRLPTEAEWEYACRAGSKDAFAGTGKLEDMGWCGGGQPQPVGQKKPNAWGIYDMHGNVFEWCYDCYGEYPKDAVTDPLGPISLGSLPQVQRGGSYAFQSRICRSANRYPAYASESKWGWEGFRVACTAGAQDVGPDFGNQTQSSKVDDERTSSGSVVFHAYEFAVGDPCDFGNPSFRKKKGIKSSDVSECFDERRRGSVFLYCTAEDKNSTQNIKVSRISRATEQYKRIVKVEDSWIFITGGTGAAEVAKLIHGNTELVATRAYKGEIVASSPNIKYRGLSEHELKKELAAALTKTAQNGGGSFGIQWKRSDNNYVAWQCCIAAKGEMVIAMSAFTVSDILVREDTYGNKE